MRALSCEVGPRHLREGWEWGVGIVMDRIFSFNGGGGKLMM